MEYTKIPDTFGLLFVLVLKHIRAADVGQIYRCVHFYMEILKINI